jgi:hypothetical protein
MTVAREFLQKCLADGTTLCRDAEPCAESLVEDWGDCIKGRDSWPHG